MITGRSSYTHTIRFPEGLKERVQQSADARHRSFNSEVIALLSEALGGTPATPYPPLDAEISRAINEHIDREVAARLRAIAANITGETA